ncbi:hypothetical protein BX661DRAFT_181845 [Kickxella alabastrina]|uniref:uncharacterized protein n=1 Tax=Kickxella alabastrina TaxID=61397 RepID=UPI00221F34FF|nr:uncharacterized protein BX661DRAFT_181845 [Kickxella alabastrina]KAI7828300.1 hypothetical protein BX661DRAFT_181845 [Kickxella alabastrina]
MGGLISRTDNFTALLRYVRNGMAGLVMWGGRYDEDIFFFHPSPPCATAREKEENKPARCANLNLTAGSLPSNGMRSKDAWNTPNKKTKFYISFLRQNSYYYLFGRSIS